MMKILAIKLIDQISFVRLLSRQENTMIGFGVYYFSLSRDIKRGISELYLTFRFPKDRGSVIYCRSWYSIDQKKTNYIFV